MAVSIASAEQTTIDSITTNPDQPIYIIQRTGVYYSDFTIIVHVTNPPPGGQLYYTNYELDGRTTLDDNGMASFPVSLQINIPFSHQCSPTFSLAIYDADGNVVANAVKYIQIYLPPSITWHNPAGITIGTALSNTQLNAVAEIPGTFVYTPALGTVLSEGTHTLHVDFTPDNTGFTTASKDVIIEVWNPVTPPITWSSPEGSVAKNLAILQNQ